MKKRRRPERDEMEELLEQAEELADEEVSEWDGPVFAAGVAATLAWVLGTKGHPFGAEEDEDLL
jgi:hypothetical protein